MSSDYWGIASLWLLWAAYWLVSAHGTKQSAQAESRSSRLTHLVLLAAAVALLVLPGLGIRLLGWRMIPDRFIAFVIGVGLEALGLGLAVWARIHLGPYWSATIDMKAEHQVIHSGPYALVRHPIYTGLVLAFLGTALAEDEITSLLALGLVVIAYTRKIWIEERWLVGHLGEEYRAYQRKVSRLIPFLW